MKVMFFGAAKEVTGSCHYIEACGKKMLIDCGMQQGSDTTDDPERLPFSPGLIDFVLLTHAHIDHSGRLPLLVKQGFSGPIYATRATCDLLRIMLMDSARIQENDAAWKAKRRKRSGKEEKDPLYTVEDAGATLELLVPVSYEELIKITQGVEATFHDAGHLLGSAAIRLALTEDGQTRSIVFSGDVGTTHRPIIRDPQPIPPSDYVVMESTYGDRLHDKIDGTNQELARVINDTLARGGNVIIPSFAVGRTQELLYRIREIKAEQYVKSVPNFPVYVDSPLALEATQIYSGDLRGYADEETIKVIKEGFEPINFPNRHLSRTTQESMFLNQDPTPKVIISSSGMCEAGRIRHHLKHNLWREECTILFVGFQANGSVGRILLDGASEIKMVGEKITVAAQIENFRFMSGHADREGLINWLSSMKTNPSKVFVVHGEDIVATAFTDTLRDRGYHAVCPNFTSAYDLISGECIDIGISREQIVAERASQKRTKVRTVSSVYRRLTQAAQQLVQVVAQNEGAPNKDLAKFADQIIALCQKWKR